MSLEPAIAARVAKLLRLACSNGPDGEKLAAIGRLSAAAMAHDLDWDQLLANGHGAALTEEQMHRIYSEGYQRGLTDGAQQAKSERDWTPTAGTSAKVGSDTERLETILKAAAQSRDAGLLTDWEVTFSNDMREKLERFGKKMYVSEKQWECLDRLENKLRRQDFIP